MCSHNLYPPQGVTYLFGGSYTKYQKFSAAFLIQCHEASIEKGILYTTGGIQGIFDSSGNFFGFQAGSFTTAFTSVLVNHSVIILIFEAKK